MLHTSQLLRDIDEMHTLQELNPKQLQINLTGFLEKNTSLFVKVRWISLPCAVVLLCALIARQIIQQPGCVHQQYLHMILPCTALPVCLHSMLQSAAIG